MAVPSSSLQYHHPDDVGIRAAADREARDSRKAQRAAAAAAATGQKNANGVPRTNGHYVSESQQSSPRRNSFAPDEEPSSPYASDGVIHEAVLVSQQQQNRTSRVNGQRGSAEQQVPSSMPPGYPGPPLEDARPRQNGAHRRQQSNGQSSGAPEIYGAHRRSGGPSSSSSAATAAAEHMTNGVGSSSAPNRRSRNLGTDLQPSFSQQQQQQRRQQPQSASLEPPAAIAGPSTHASRISRLESPSVIKSVLQPLDKKISEYDQLMTDASTEMTTLDEEIRALQVRRQLAEDRFLGAKAKHDDYARQRDDVDQAMRGEWPPAASAPDHRAVAFAPTPVMTPQQQQPMAPQQGMARNHDGDSVDERPRSRDSEYSHSRMGIRDRLRLSGLFRR